MKKLIFTSIALLMLLNSAVLQTEQWKFLQIKVPLACIAFVDSTLGYIYSNELRWKTTNGGISWEIEKNAPYYIGNSSPYSVYFSSGVGISAKNNWDVMRSTNGGFTWNNISTGIFIGKSVHFVEPNNWYVYGEAAAYNFNIIKSKNSGLGFTTVTNPQIGSEIMSLFFINEQNGFATGSIRDTFAFTSDGGGSWIKRSLGTNYHYYTHIFFANQNDGWILTDYYDLIKTTDGGINWNIIHTPAYYTSNMTFIDSLTGCIIGHSGAGTGGVITKTTDGGNIWSAPVTNAIPDEYPLSIKFKDKNTGWVVGQSGYISTTVNGGLNWWSKNFDLPNGILKSVIFSDPNTLWLTSINDDRSIWKSTNSGSNWIKVYNSSPILTNINSLHSFTNDKILGVGDYGIVVLTTNGGNSWDVQNIGTNNFNSVSFYGPNTGWIAGSGGSIYKTGNGGLNWENQTYNTTQSYLSVCALSENKCIAAGNNNLVSMTIDGGASWQIQTGLEDRNHMQVYFTKANTGFIISSKFFWSGISNYYSANSVYKTINGGANWAKVCGESFAYGHFLNSISFMDSLKGTIVGENGRFLKTTNGGNNWYQYIPSIPLPDYTDLYSVSYFNNAGVAVGSHGILMSNGINIVGISNDNMRTFDFKLYQNFPNPFNPSTIISFELRQTSDISLKVFDITGRIIKILYNGIKTSGKHEIVFDAGSGNISSGIYFYTLESNGSKETRKFLFLK